MHHPDREDAASLPAGVPVKQRQAGRADRLGWLFLAALVAAGLLGAWGDGPFSTTRVASPDGNLVVSYERFARNLGDTRLEVRMTPSRTGGGVARLHVGQSYLAGFQVQATTPEPTTVLARNGQWIYEFPVEGGAQLLVRFDLRPSGGMGLREGAVGTTSGSVRFTQLIYP